MGFFSGIGDFFGGIGSGIVDAVTGAGDFLGDLVTDVGDTLGGLGTAALGVGGGILGSSLAGGNTFSGGGTTTTTTREPLFTPEQLSLLMDLVKRAQAGVSGPTTPYPGLTYVPATPDEQAYMRWASQIASGRLGRLMQGEPAFTTSPSTTQEWFRQYEEPAYWKTWEERVKPVIQEQYAGPGYWGSDRAQAVTRSAEDLAAQINQTLGQRMYSDELARRQALSDAYDRITGATMIGGNIMPSGAALGRAIKEQEVLSQIQRWLSGEPVGGVQSPYLGPQTQLALALLGISPYTYQTQITQTSPGWGYGALQGAGSGIGKGLGSALGDIVGDIFSDLF